MAQLTYTSAVIDDLLEDLNDKSSVYAYLSASATTTTTAATTWYPIQGTFVNDFVNFELDTDKIKYIGTNSYKFEIDWSIKLASDTANTTLNVTVAINGTPTEETKMGLFLKTAGDAYTFSGTQVITLDTNDTVQLIVQSDKSGAVLTVGQLVTTLNKFTIPRQ